MRAGKCFIILFFVIVYTNCSSKEQVYKGLYQGLQTKERLDEQYQNRNHNEIPQKVPLRYEEYQDKIHIDTFVDKKASGWSYTTNQQAFVAKVGECSIKYTLLQFKDKSRKTALSSRSDCDKSFEEQAPLHKAILEKIFATYPNEEWGHLSWGSFIIGSRYQSTDCSWSLPIAKASAHSKEYKHYRLHYPNTPYSTNSIFVKLANETLSYRGLKIIFNELGFDITLSSVEKVFTKKAKDFRDYPALKKEGIDAKQRLIYDVGMSYFEIKALP
jgi:hypothetical protein